MIPGVGTSDKFVPITLAYEWIQHNANIRDPICYAVVQTYIWGCVGGYAEDWEIQEEAQKKLEKEAQKKLGKEQKKLEN